MSTYLACFIICDFDYLEKFSEKDNKPLRVYVTKHQISQGQADFALDIFKGALDYYENELFKIDYPLPKMDFIAIPDFVTGAMENWGLITFRETALLYADGVSSSDDQERVAEVVAHELSHMWFGDLVTMQWWDNLWLNEGFATYFASIGVDNALKYAYNTTAQESWNMENRAILDITKALRVDSSPTTHAIINEADTSDRITAVFDDITYAKGCSFIWSMIQVMGFEQFFTGVTEYLRANQYGVVTEQDLINALMQSVDWPENQKNIFRQYFFDNLNQAGYPLMKLEGDSLTQVQYFNTLETPATVTTWNIPLKNEFTWLTSKTGQLSLQPTEMASQSYKSFSRVQYSIDKFNLILDNLVKNLEDYDEIDRTQFVDDAFHLASSGHYQYGDILSVINFMKNEDSYYVWHSFTENVYGILGKLPIEENVKFSRILLPLVQPIAEKIGWDATQGTHLQKIFRPIILGFQLSLGDQASINKAVTMFNDWINQGIEVHPDLKNLVYNYGMKFEPEENLEHAFYFVLEQLAISTVAAEQQKLIRCLASTNNVKLSDELIKLTFYGTQPSNYHGPTALIRDQDVTFTLTMISSRSETGNKMVWSWLRVHWSELVDKFTISDRTLGRFPPSVVEGFSTEEQLWEVRDFYESTEDGAGEAYRSNSLSTIESNIYWRDNNLDSIVEWINDQNIVW